MKFATNDTLVRARIGERRCFYSMRIHEALRRNGRTETVIAYELKVMREVLNIIATIEQVAATNGMKRIDIADLEGIVLSHDWQNRTPRGVRTKKVA